MPKSLNEHLVKSPKMSLRAKRSNLVVGHKLQFSKDRFVAPLLAMTCFSTFYELLLNVRPTFKIRWFFLSVGNRPGVQKKVCIKELRYLFFSVLRFQHFHPLITPNGLSLATFFEIPAPATASTTSDTFLYASGISSAMVA